MLYIPIIGCLHADFTVCYHGPVHADILEHYILVIDTEMMAFLLQICGEDQVVEDLPQHLLATTVELGTEALILEKDSEVVLAQCIRELKKRFLVLELMVDGFDHVEKVVSAQVYISVETEELVCFFTQDGFEILIGGGTKTEQEPPRGGETRAGWSREFVNGAKNTGECGWIIIFEFDRGLLALLLGTLALYLRKSRKVGTDCKVAVWAAQLAEVLVLLTHNDLVYLDLAAIAELDGQVGVVAFVEPLADIHGGQRFGGRGWVGLVSVSEVEGAKGSHEYRVRLWESSRQHVTESKHSHARANQFQPSLMAWKTINPHAKIQYRFFQSRPTTSRRRRQVLSIQESDAFLLTSGRSVYQQCSDLKRYALCRGADNTSCSTDRSLSNTPTSRQTHHVSKRATLSTFNRSIRNAPSPRYI
jgi:hypothetical protein